MSPYTAYYRLYGDARQIQEETYGDGRLEWSEMRITMRFAISAPWTVPWIYH